MAWTPVVKRSVAGDVFEQIADEVLSGELAVGSSLPSERQLAEALGVSRPAVREALQRLSAAGLVSVRQGGTTTVLDYRRSAGLEVLPRLLLRGRTIDPAVARSVLEARLHNGPKIAELAAARVRAHPRHAQVVTVLRELDETTDRLAESTDPLAQQLIALEYWDHVLDLADSIAFRLMYSMLRAAYEPALPALAPVMSAEVGNIGAYRHLAAAIGAGAPDLAADRARALLTPATTALLDALDAATPTDEV
ncbi:FadR/GntR family transcriptional regulator [Nocardia stercoris]|uniref:FadR family transcriptional regulator n=1 Tax=Nocardia stercoris TaxID=2483361 RepID=A0A3M2LDI8_9NOCA|nr:GntR family transcriptional regulator [Nocardia stercoris]RMI35532.1 FadR family transcriptional regulator [Nocardia stercoris]